MVQMLTVYSGLDRESRLADIATETVRRGHQTHRRRPYKTEQQPFTFIWRLQQRLSPSVRDAHGGYLGDRSGRWHGRSSTREIS